MATCKGKRLKDSIDMQSGGGRRGGRAEGMDEACEGACARGGGRRNCPDACSMMLAVGKQQDPAGPRHHTLGSNQYEQKLLASSMKQLPVSMMCAWCSNDTELVRLRHAVSTKKHK